MKINRFIYVEQNENYELAIVKPFSHHEMALEYAKVRLQEILLKLEIKIPAKYIDEDGFIDYMPAGVKEEVTSCEYGWTVYDGVLDTYRGMIEPLDIELAPEEIEVTYRKQQKKYQVEDAERQLTEYLLYTCCDTFYATDPEGEDEAINEYLHEHCGEITIDDLVNPESEQYVLDQMVQMFEDRFDCNLDENSIWTNIASDVINNLKKEDENNG